jgi:UDP-N-acetylmuramoyl-tripeptide--D-alanyl-D-alanine ligase
MELKVSEIIDATKGWLLTGTREGSIIDVSIDSRKVTDGNLFIPLEGTQHDGHAFIEDAFKHGANASLAQKGNSILPKLKRTYQDKILIEVDDPLKSLGDIAYYWRRKFATEVVAITGSNGKTTTKEIAWNIIKRKLRSIKNQGNWNNLIGLPLSLFQLDGSQQAAILEMGMSGTGEIRRLSEISKPQIGLITNIGPSHLEQLETLEEVKAVKGELFEYFGSKDTAIVNNDDFRVASLAKSTCANILSFGIKKGDVQALSIRSYNCYGTAFDLIVMGEKRAVQLKLLGEQFISNALAAASIACALGIGIEDIKKGLESFTGVPGRMETIDLPGVTVINDSYNANPVSMHASLATLSSITSSNRKIAVLGDMLELGRKSQRFHTELGETVAHLHVDYLFLIGNFSSYVREGAVSAGMNSNNIILCKDIKTLTDKLKEKMDDGDAILLKGSRKMRMEKVIELLQQDEG